MAVRNFYTETTIDGRRTKLAGGPQSKTGGMCIRITQRAQGTIEPACTIRCFEEDGKLVTVVYDDVGIAIYEKHTTR